jgi:hypothetical protein
MTALHGIPDVENLALEHEVGGGVVGYGFGATCAQLAAACGPLPPALRQWVARRELWEASPFAFLEYDGDHDEFEFPHVFFRLTSFGDSGVTSAFANLLLESGEPMENRAISRAMQRLVDRLPWSSRSGYLGFVSRRQVREVRVQFPIDVHEIRSLIEDVAGRLGDGLESIVVSLERAELRRMNLQLGIGPEGVGGRVGIELGVTHWQSHAPKVWRDIADGLVDTNISAAFHGQLDAWWGTGEKPLSHARWSHVKLATGSERIQLKHYLWLRTLEEKHEVGESSVG